MGETSAIEWTDATWNPIRGCTRVSEGCRHCYAETLAARFSEPGQWGHGLAVRTPKGARWTGRIDVAADATFLAPLRWKRPRRIFVNSLSDLFHEAVPDAVIDRVFAVMALSPQHTFQLLTKRPERMLRYLTHFLVMARIAQEIDFIRDGLGLWQGSPAQRYAAAIAKFRVSERWPLPNVWLGVSVEDQAAADARIPLLLATPAAKRFLSCEPLLGALDFHDHLIRAVNGFAPGIDWVIAGGESGPGARPMHPHWARSLRDQCAAAGVPFFFKQWGEWAPGDQVLPPLRPCDVSAAHWEEEPVPGPDSEVPYPMAFRCGKKRAGKLLDGRQHLEWPE